MYTVPEGKSISCKCLRPENHEGPDLIHTLRDEYIVWGEDMCPSSEECAMCVSEDPADWCVAFMEVTAEEAQNFMESATYGGVKWEPR